jgi:hypothetical protein
LVCSKTAPFAWSQFLDQRRRVARSALHDRVEAQLFGATLPKEDVVVEVFLTGANSARREAFLRPRDDRRRIPRRGATWQLSVRQKFRGGRDDGRRPQRDRVTDPV